MSSMSRTRDSCWKSRSRGWPARPRHKSGIAMRFPRISRLRWDKPPREADRLETLERMLKADANQTLTPSTEVDVARGKKKHRDKRAAVDPDTRVPI